MIRPTYPENPVIAKFFKEIGRVDEVGSGVRNTFKYCGIYTPGTKPEFIEENIFKTIIPLKANESEEVVSAPNWGEVWRKVRGKFGENSRADLWRPVHICPRNDRNKWHHRRAVEKQLARLKEKDVIERIGPGKRAIGK